MSELLSKAPTFGLFITIFTYYIGTCMKAKFKLAIFNPLIISVGLTIIVLLLLDVNYQDYSSSAEHLSFLLTPATVSLAIPLYEKLDLLKRNLIAILIGIIAGVVSSLLSVFALAKLFSLTYEEFATLLPKSITTAIGIGVSEELGGITTITVAAIIITGIIGNMTAELICRLFRIKNPISRGVAIGTSSHAVGTAKAMEMGEVEGAMSSLAIVISGLCTVIGASVIAGIY